MQIPFFTLEQKATCFALAILGALIAGCGPSKSELEAESAQLIAEYNKKEAEIDSIVTKEFAAATDNQLRGLLVTCEHAIMDIARAEYKPFEPFMVNSYSADRLQARTISSGGRVQAEDEIFSRVQKYRLDVKVIRKHLPPMLNSRFSVMVTRDSFSGPERINRQAQCRFRPGFKAIAEWS